ncbi:hypothetical protein LTR65_002186 [Meristemomyces frigidus]
MGRQQHLTRLALGRSAFQDPDDDSGFVAEATNTAQSTSQPANGGYVQQHDSKGRPVNPATQARNAEMRRAQNSVLVLVGVVESRERSEHHNEIRFRHIREARHALLKEEQDRGEDLDLLASVVTTFFSWWADCLLQRFLIGLYDAKIPFAEVVGSEWQNLWSGGLKGAHSTLFPGAVPYLAYLAARVCLDVVVSEPVNRVSELVWKKPIRRQTRQRLDAALHCVYATLRIATDLPLLPLCYYATAQQLGLAPAWPLLPPMKSYLPWHPTSVHSFGWKHMVGIPLLGVFCSPAALLLVRLALTSDTEADVPLAGDYTTFRYPQINDPSDMVHHPNARDDPLGWVLDQSYSLRMRVLNWCSWDVASEGRRPERRYEQDVRLTVNSDGVSTKHTHRSTSMAHLPPSFLASRIDRFLEKLMMLPLESVMLRAVEISYLSSPLPKTSMALAATPTLYAPFGRGPLAWLRSPASATELLRYAGKVGLCLALRVIKMNHAQEHLQREARSCYKRRDYHKALELFNRAIGRAGSVQLLDNRAACCEKLNDLPAALKDAKKAIQLQREDPTGYLRAGKILVKMEKQSVALEIYTHGLKTVKHVGQGYELLRRVHGDLLSELSPPKSVDPLTVLPRELAELILEYLTFQQRMNACLVTKQWAHFIRSTPNLWQHLDLSQARRKVRSAFISRSINTAKQKLTAATLSMLHDFDKSLVALIRYCPIQDLVLLETGLQSRNLVEALERARHLKRLHLARGTEIGPTALAQVISKCAGTLETLECSHISGDSLSGIPILCQNLVTISLTTAGCIHGSTILADLPEFTPNLRSLKIHASSTRSGLSGIVDLSKLQNLKSVDLRLPIPAAQLLRLPPTLSSLRLATTCNPLNDFFKDVSAPSGFTRFYLPHLHELSTDLGETHVNSLANLLESEDPTGAQATSRDRTVAQSKLQELSIRAPRVAMAELDALLSHPRLPELTKFALQPMGVFDDEQVHVVAEKLPALQTVDLSETDITGVGVKDLVQRGHIRHLVLNDCRHLGSDAVEWARSQGVRVDYRMTSSERGGKKLRY